MIGVAVGLPPHDRLDATTLSVANLKLKMNNEDTAKMLYTKILPVFEKLKLARCRETVCMLDDSCVMNGFDCLFPVDGAQPRIGNAQCVVNCGVRRQIFPVAP